MLTPKQLTAYLIAEYGDLETALYDNRTDGICHNCGFITAGVEPDAEDYRCEACGVDAVHGIEYTILTML